MSKRKRRRRPQADTIVWAGPNPADDPTYLREQAERAAAREAELQRVAAARHEWQVRELVRKKRAAQSS